MVVHPKSVLDHERAIILFLASSELRELTINCSKDSATCPDQSLRKYEEILVVTQFLRGILDRNTKRF